MKLKIKKNIKNIRVNGIAIVGAIIFLVIAISAVWAGNYHLIASGIIYLFLIPIALRPYLITDTDQLVGAGIISIRLISHIERKAKGGVRVYYTWIQEGRMRSRSFYPKDEQLFINKLIEINPNIKLN